MKAFVVISKFDDNEPHMPADWAGKGILMSFASAPVWKSFRYIFLQKDQIPNYMDKNTALYALKKYANPQDYEVMPYEQAQKEYETFLREKGLSK